MGDSFLKLHAKLTFVFMCMLAVNYNASAVFGASARHSYQPFDDTEQLEDNFEQPDQELQRAELDNIKKTVIESLGLDQIPDMDKMNVSQEEYSRMYGVYLQRVQHNRQVLRLHDLDDQEDADDDTPIPTLYTFHQKDRHMRKKRRKGVWHVQFDLETFEPVNSMEDRPLIEHSNLRLLVPGISADISKKYGNAIRIQVYQVMGRGKPSKLVSEKHMRLSTKDPKWVELDVSEATASWLTYGQNNLGLELWCEGCESRHVRLLDGPVKATLNALVVKFETDQQQDGNGDRSKRSAEQALYYVKDRRTDCTKNNKKCCRQRMDFDLTQLGFDFIIQPKTFDGGICRGRCPPRYNSAHNHAILQSLMWKKDKSLMPRVCCAPSKLRELEILIVDENDPTKLMVKPWEGIVVMECACS